jgi:monooxygenase
MSAPEIDTDVCVVGGGPGGLALALALLGSGVAVTVVERSRSLRREYRGEILQPGGQLVLADLGALAGAKARGCYELPNFQLVERGRTLMDIDYRRLGRPHDHLLSIPQRHVLEELLELCGRHANFRYLPGTRVTGLERDGDRVTGVRWDGGGVTARCVVGADGRYSKVRQLAGIDGGRDDTFEQDVLWCRLRAPGRLTGQVRVHRVASGAVLVYDSYPDCVQIGWTLPHKGYAEFAGRGVEHVKAELARALPDYADLVDDQITKLGDLSLLDVFAGCAPRWAADGLVLIGDSAHTHSPLGAQGINLALQDAAALHPVLLAALDGPVTAEALAPFERRRRPAVRAVTRFQVRQSRAMLARGPVMNVVRPVVARVLAGTPLGDKLTRWVAFGGRPVRISATARPRVGSSPCA